MRDTLESLPKVLNPNLYRRLQELFGSVRVANPLELFEYEIVTNPLNNRQRLIKRTSGEYYRVCCPFCGDTHFKLYISHMYGKRLKDGRRGTFLINCRRRNCMDDLENRHTFVDRLEALGTPLEQARIYTERQRHHDRPTHFTLPGTCVPLVDLPPTHRANRYLGARGFDIRAIPQEYDLRYCQSCFDRRLQLAIGRIIVPIYRGPALVGWQGRYPGELDWKREDVPKYYTCPGMDRSSYVLALERARHYHSGVLVEGWWDCFRMGRMAVPLMGSDINERQMAQIAQAFRGRSFVWLLDPDQWDDAKQVAQREQMRKMLANHSVQLAPIKLPGGFDPAGLDRPRLRLYVRQEAARQSVRVSFKRVQ